MKKTLLTIALLFASSAAMAVDPNDPYLGVYDGYSSLNYSSTGYAQGNEINTAGGFCSLTAAAGCPAGAGGPPLVGPMIPGTTTALALGATDIIESGSGAGMAGATGALGLITPAAAPAATAASNAGTYTSIQGVTNGGYKVTSLNDPGTLGTVTGSAIAFQKPDAGLANTTTVSDSVASSMRGQANSFSTMVVQAQAITPN